MDDLTIWRWVTLVVLLAIILAPLLHYRRSRNAGERLGDWIARIETTRLNNLGRDLRAARWLSPRLCFRVLVAVGFILYGVFWFMAVLMVLGDLVKLQWSWRRVASPMEPMGIVLETLVLGACLGFWYLFRHGRPAGEVLDGRRLCGQWLAMLAYGWLFIQVMPWAIADPQFFITRMAVISKPLPSRESMQQAWQRMANASEEDIYRWIDNGTLPRGFTANSSPRPAPPDVLLTLRQRFAGRVIEPEMQRLSGGTFFMGCDPAFEQRLEPGTDPAIAQALKDSLACAGNERPRHRQEVAAFALGRMEVTFDEWDACVADGGCLHWPDDGGFGRGNLPVRDVSWDDIQHYITWLNRRTGKAYRLPTEAEWEYAARNGTDTAFGTGRCLLPQAANTNGDRLSFSNCPGWEAARRPLAVGSLEASPWGLYDMHGNVAEWVHDCRTFGYDPAGPKCPSGVDRQRRAYRGGSWMEGAENARSAYRSFARHDARMEAVGFRLALDLPVGVDGMGVAPAVNGSVGTK